MREDLQTGFPDAPNWLLTFLKDKTIDDLLIEKLFSDIFGYSLSRMNDLPLDSDTGLFEYIQVVVLEKGLCFFRSHIGSHLRD